MHSPDSAPRIITRLTRRTARYVVLGTPPAAASVIWFALHGYGQLAPRFANRFVGCLPDECCVVAPEGLSRFYAEAPRGDGTHLQRVGATWMTREAREDDIADTLHWLALVYADVMGEAPAGVRVGVLGFSQGVATASRWLATGTVRPQRFVAWAGRTAHDVHEVPLRACLQQADVLFVCGDQDPFFAEEQAEAELAVLRRWQPGATRLRFAGAHQLDGSILRQVLAALAG
jgi:dienelactone hydrolase